MSIVQGRKIYDCSQSKDGKKVEALSLFFNENEIESALKNEVYNRLYDIEMRNEQIQLLCAGLSDTGFRKEDILNIINQQEDFEDWRVGEAFSEVYLSSYYNAFFPWNIERDSKKPHSSLPGMDIIGFDFTNDEIKFLFGEVKTSSENKFPPQVMNGRSGMKSQLEYVLNTRNVRNAIYYIFNRLTKEEKNKYYIKAFQNLFANKYTICGVLVRDTDPNEKDISLKASNLVETVNENQKLFLLALYVPLGYITQFSQIIKDENIRRAASC